MVNKNMGASTIWLVSVKIRKGSLNFVCYLLYSQVGCITDMEAVESSAIASMLQLTEKLPMLISVCIYAYLVSFFFVYVGEANTGKLTLNSMHNLCCLCCL